VRSYRIQEGHDPKWSGKQTEGRQSVVDKQISFEYLDDLKRRNFCSFQITDEASVQGGKDEYIRRKGSQSEVFAQVGFKGETKGVLRAEGGEKDRILRELGRGC